MEEQFLDDLKWELLEQGIDECFVASVIEDLRDELEIDQ